MEAYITKAFGSSEYSTNTQVNQPKISAHQLLVKVHCVSINPIDWKTRQGLGWAANLIKNRLPISLGFDFSGEIAQVGEQLESQWQMGERVCGIQNIAKHAGSFAQFITVDTSDLVRVPEKVDMIHAAALPIAGLTAYQAINRMGINAADDCLVNGASGGVGHLMVQLLQHLGCQVSGTCSTPNVNKLAAIGVNALDYLDEHSIQSIKETFSVILDNVGGDSAIKALDYLRRKGTMLTLPTVSFEEVRKIAFERNLMVDNLLVKMDRLALESLLKLVENQQLTTWIDEVFPFKRIHEAFEKSQTGHPVGKIVVRILNE